MPSDTDTLSESSSGASSWQDLESDSEPAPQIVSLADGSTVFPSAAAMLAHDMEKHGFNYMAVLRSVGICDFLTGTRLVNYVRTRVRDGKSPVPSEGLTRAELGDGDEYLRPVLKDDALLACLGDVLGDDEEEAEEEAEEEGRAGEGGGDGDAADPADLRRQNRALRRELRELQSRFDSHRIAVDEMLEKKWEQAEGAPAPTAAAADASESYWTSYAGIEIHETMLKDKVRTEAYRDFAAKHGDQVFAGKTVLDVGCGTGILSMFCARAGAARVFAVDRSDIVDRAREIVYANKLDGVITCLRGEIEDVVLPVESVDVIVSEWMGYGLLFEAMLPSVLHARDRWLAPGGLMVPSAATLWVAPVSDPAYAADKFSFWRDVYGFDMSPMLRRDRGGAYDAAHVTTIAPGSVAGRPSQVLRLDLHTAKAEDLSFTRGWSSTLQRDIGAIDGLVVWFDIFFGRSRDPGEIPDGATAEEWIASGPEGSNIGFTTEPAGTATHWEQCVLSIRPGAEEVPVAAVKTEDSPTAAPLVVGTEVKGDITYAPLEGDASARSLAISASWEVEGGVKGRQRWRLV